jgi:shikimate kinase
VNLRLKQTPGVYLVGFMGCGKSTVGRLLADALGWTFLDLDEEIERAQGQTISSLFETLGEPAFREIERQALARLVRRVECGRPHVIALGGGAFAQPGTAGLLETRGVTVWLDCPFDLVTRRVSRHSHRPLARDPMKFQQLFEARRQAYAQADYRVEVDDGDPANHVKSILRLEVFQ